MNFNEFIPYLPFSFTNISYTISTLKSLLWLKICKFRNPFTFSYTRSTPPGIRQKIT